MGERLRRTTRRSTGTRLYLAHWTPGQIFFLFAPLAVVIAIEVSGTIPSRTAVAVVVLAYAASIAWCLCMWFLSGRHQQLAGWGVLLIAHAVWFALPAAYQVVRPAIWFGDWIGFTVPNEDLFRAGTAISLFLVASAIGFTVVGSTRVVPPAPRSLVTRRQSLAIVLAFAGIGVMPYALFGGELLEIVSSVLAGRTDKPWAASPESGYEGSATMTLFWTSRAFLVSAAVLSACYFITRRDLSPPVRLIYGGILFVAVFLIYFDQGTRSMLAMALIPLTGLYLLRSGEQRRRSRMIGVGAVAAALMLALTQFQLFYREERTRTEMLSKSGWELFSPNQHIDFFTETANAVTVRHTQLSGDLGESPLLFFLLNPIPRVLWPEKPMAQTMWEFSFFRRGVDIWSRGGNSLPSVVGQYYMNAGLLGVLWAGLLYGLVAAWFGRLANHATSEWTLAGFSGLAFIFVSFRFLFPGFHYSTLALFGLAWLASRRVGHRGAVSERRLCTPPQVGYAHRI